MNSKEKIRVRDKRELLIESNVRNEDILRWAVVEDAIRDPRITFDDAWHETTYEKERVHNRGHLCPY